MWFRKGLDSLEELNIEGNLISTIEDSTFDNTPRLAVIHLEENLLRDVSPIHASNLIAVFLNGNVPLFHKKHQVSLRRKIIFKICQDREIAKKKNTQNKTNNKHMDEFCN